MGQRRDPCAQHLLHPLRIVRHGAIGQRHAPLYAPVPGMPGSNPPRELSALDGTWAVPKGSPGEIVGAGESRRKLAMSCGRLPNMHTL